MGSRVSSGKGFSFFQAVIPLKILLNRLSFFLFLCASLTIIIIGRSDRVAMENFRASVVDSVTPVLAVLASPIKAVAEVKESSKKMLLVYEENKLLKQENKRLGRIQAMAERLEIENRRLKELLHFIPDATVSYIAARVVTGTSGPYTRSAIISAGKSENIKKGSVVVNDDGLVGRIIEVGSRSSRILLITDINSRVPVITGVSGERGIISGKNSEILILDHLPLDSEVKEGEKIVTTGDGSGFPPGIPVGIIESVSNKAVTVKPYVSWNRLEYVSVADYKPLEE